MSELRGPTDIDRDLEFRRLSINARRADNAFLRQQVKPSSGDEFAAAAEDALLARNELARYEHEAQQGAGRQTR